MALAPDIERWFAEHLPAGWFNGPATVEVDADEIFVAGDLPIGAGGGAAAQEAAIAKFREESRDERMRIAEAAERLFRRKVSWGARSGDIQQPFTTLSMPVMTRLRQPERKVLDTLIAAGVARSRSEALNWCVRLVAEKQAEWLRDLKSALETVERARAKGPSPPR
ncbi:MAG: hypothetical protein NVS9B1_03860 [Candidatus Dormibacteraceae bacterium]